MLLKDADIRDELCYYLEEQYGEIRFFDELTMGRSRADIVMVTRNGVYGVEIKSDADTYTRLPRQIKDYDRYFDYNYVVVGSRHANHIGEHIPDYWGVISVEYVDDKIDFYRICPPGKSPKVKLKNQLSLLWRRELQMIQKENCLYKYAGKSRAFVENYIMESLTPDKLREQIIDILYERDYSIFKKQQKAGKKFRKKCF